MEFASQLNALPRMFSQSQMFRHNQTSQTSKLTKLDKNVEHKNVLAHTQND
jgi:hypothetical protein